MATVSKHIGTGTFTATPKAIHYVNDVLRSGRITYGPYSQRFERDFAALHGCRFGILSNSGTSSLLVALQTMKELHGWRDGDGVIVPALTFVATVNVVLQLRLKPVLVDIERDYYGLDCDLVEGKINKRTRCIMPVHTFGQPVDGTALYSAIEPFGGRLRILEDSCEAMFVNHQGVPVGLVGDIACFSTYTAHLLTTGVGGIAITNHSDYARTMRSLVNHGMSYDDLSGGDNGFTPTKTRRDFKFDRIGHSFRITEMEAALGLAQLEEWQGMIATRQCNATYLSERLAPLEDRLQLPKIRPCTTHAFMMFPLVCKQPDTRDNLTRHLERRGIETRRMLPLTCQPVYREWCNEDDYPVAKWVNENGFYVGCHQGLDNDDLDYLADTIGEFYAA